MQLKKIKLGGLKTFLTLSKLFYWARQFSVQCENKWPKLLAGTCTIHMTSPNDHVTSHDTRAGTVCIIHYLFLDVLEGGGRDNGEADEKDVRLWVGQRSQPVVVLLTWSR